jgi:hypothetical protein
LASERRFILLFLSLFVLLSALGAVVGRTSPRTLAAGSRTLAAPVAAPAKEQTSPPAIDRALSPVTKAEQPQLGQLWATGLRDRLSRLASSPPNPTIDNKQIVSYYGNPNTPSMGVLGTADLETIAAELQARARSYDELNGDLGVIPAIHLVYAVAQYHPTDNGLYLQYTSDEDVQRYLDLTRRDGMLLFLDLQIGRSSVSAEVRKALPYLRYPQVHLAIDPEFAVPDGEVPGLDLGSLTGGDVNDAQSILQQLVDEESLPPKILIVHQFADSMLRDTTAISAYSNVRLVLDMDGFGLAEIKRAKYEALAAQPYAARAGIKLFFHDDPDMMSESEVLSLVPVPTVVIYQ